MPLSSYQVKWRLENPEKCLEYSRRSRAKESTKERQRQWMANNRHRYADYGQRYREENSEKYRASKRKWEKENREHINRKERERCAVDMSYKMARRLRVHLWKQIRRQQANKSSSAANLVGCEMDFLMGYIEALFRDGMKWSNYGKVWEIDHIIPCSKFNLQDESHQRSCFHYTNLQPLFVTENRTKWANPPNNPSIKI